jgi:hypothetical protein
VYAKVSRCGEATGHSGDPLKNSFSGAKPQAEAEAEIEAREEIALPQRSISVVTEL